VLELVGFEGQSFKRKPHYLAISEFTPATAKRKDIRFLGFAVFLRKNAMKCMKICHFWPIFVYFRPMGSSHNCTNTMVHYFPLKLQF
jgi:hypothetical protein